MEINGHNGIFVGGASGMALATAEKFKAGGGNVAILDLPTSDGAAVAERGSLPRTLLQRVHTGASLCAAGKVRKRQRVRCDLVKCIDWTGVTALLVRTGIAL